MKISNYANRVEPSLARALFNKAKLYDDVIDLTLGDPDFSTPEHIQDAACRAIKRGDTHYSANVGLKDACNAAALNIKRHWGIDADPAKEIMITVGGMEALFLSLAALIDPGDEVIIFAPYYVNYIQMIRFLGGVPVIINAYNEEKGLFIDGDALKESITERTAAVIINSPNNPTGGIFTKDDLSQLYKATAKNGITVISDEVYRSLIFDGERHESILSNYKSSENIILIDSLSKEFCMTGWRVGYAYGDPEIIAAMVKLQENVAACVSLPSQYAMIEAYTNFEDNGDVTKQFEKRRDFLCNGINAIDKLSCVNPKGTFYLFVNIEKTGLDSITFADRLIEGEHVAVVPGEAYGEGYKGYIRIAFTKDISILKSAVERIARFVSKL